MDIKQDKFFHYKRRCYKQQEALLEIGTVYTAETGNMTKKTGKVTKVHIPRSQQRMLHHELVQLENGTKFILNVLLENYSVPRNG